MDAKHFDEGKPPLEQIPWLSEEGIAKCFAYGEKKYGRYNWCKGMPWMKLLGSCRRHLSKLISGEDLDAESGLPHIDHLATDAIMLSWMMKKGKGTDDRYKEEAERRARDDG